MKASELFDSKNGELRHKVRTVKDLIRFIQTKENKEVSNYSIFLGAGASRSSGIATANELIKEWMLELYERYENKPFIIDRKQEDSDNSETCDKSNDELIYDSLKKYFEREHSSWFDVTNPYSSLFEKKFDLAPQRRRFVEQEVDNKLPSIGYAYLVSLVENNYFNAIFTTNFDDLLNEAFYQLSSTRPIVCAHDSSVHSISISSKRPKIIKLHGDYLFEDIKSTLRETESLEHNTKDKLIEFCKEYGLIFLGYAGNDRSIMDVIDTLIKNDTYLKNGIYWCVRKEDYINPTLKSLFWKEKVYPVIIEGFDEFFSEVHHELLPDVKFFNNYRETKQQRIIQRILENKPSYNNPFISKDINYLEFESERQDFSYLLSEEFEDKEDQTQSRMALRDSKKLIEIKRLISSNPDQAYSLAKEYLVDAPNELLKTKLLEVLIDQAFTQKNNEDYNKWVNQLIEFDPYDFNFYKIKLNNIKDYKDKYEEAIKFKDKFNFESHYYNYLSSVCLELFETLKEFKNENTLNEIDGYLEKSLDLDPSLENSAWRYKVKIFKKRQSLIPNSRENESKRKTLENEAFKIIEGLRKNSPNNIDLLSHEVFFVNLFNSKEYAVRLIDDLYSKLHSSSRHHRMNIILFLNSLFNNHELDLPIDKKVDFYKTKVTIDESTPIEALATKLQIAYLNKEELGWLKSQLDKLIKKKDFFDEFEKIAELAKLIDEQLLLKIENILNAKVHEIKPQYYFKFHSILSQVKENYQEAIDNLEKEYEYKPLDNTYFMRKSFLNLKNCSYQEAIEVFEDYEANGYDSDSDVIEVTEVTHR